jgi:hypothetical protein
MPDVAGGRALILLLLFFFFVYCGRELVISALRHSRWRARRGVERAHPSRKN